MAQLDLPIYIKDLKYSTCRDEANNMKTREISKALYNLNKPKIGQKISNMIKGPSLCHCSIHQVETALVFLSDL